VLPDDVKLLAAPALVHRLIVRPESTLRGYTADRILGSLLLDTPLDIGDLSESAAEPSSSALTNLASDSRPK
jgi:MoxR-like ATPase